jgi:hypothetical protein
MFGAWGLVSRNTQTNGLSPAGTLWYAFDECGNVAQRVGGGGCSWIVCASRRHFP